MEFVFDVDFLYSFQDDYNKKQSDHQIVETILTEYTLFSFVLISEESNIDLLEKELIVLIPYFRTLMTNLGGNISYYRTLEQYLLDKKNHQRQSIIFSDQINYNEELLHNSNKVGFSYKNLFEDILKFNNSFKINKDKINELVFWNQFNNYPVALNKVVISDKYILRESSDSVINKAKYLFKQSNNAQLIVFYDVVPKIKKEIQTIDNIKNYLNKTHTTFLSVFSTKKSKSINLIHLESSKLKNRFDFHDRYIYHPFGIIESGRGYDYENKMEISNSSIKSNTVLDKFTFDLMKNHFKMLNTYIESIKKSKYQTNQKILFYPKEISQVGFY